MTETQGMIAGMILLFALFVYTFWPENSFASQKQKTRLDYLLERKEQHAQEMTREMGKVIAETRAIIEDHGQKMRGWLGPGLTETWETPDILDVFNTHPACIFSCHLPDEPSNLLADLWLTAARPGTPAPVPTEARAMPADDGLSLARLPPRRR